MIVWEVMFHDESPEGSTVVYCPSKKVALEVRREMVRIYKEDANEEPCGSDENGESVYRQVPIRKKNVIVSKIDLGILKGKALAIYAMHWASTAANQSPRWQDLMKIKLEQRRAI